MTRSATRRHFLKGLGGSAVALPLLSGLGGTSQAQANAPKRFIAMFTPNGNWVLPNGMDFAGSMIEALSPLKDKVTLVSGLDMPSVEAGPGEPHQQGMAWLTGSPLNEGNQRGGDGSRAGYASGISIDQAIAATVGQDTPHGSLQLGVQTTAYAGTEVRTVISYAGSDQPLSNENDPYNLFDRIFSDVSTDPTETNTRMEELRVRRKSILDAVDLQYAALAPRLGIEDRVKVEQHLTAVRDVEVRLSNSGAAVGGACAKPELAGRIDLDDPANFDQIGRLQTDLMVAAMRCDLTRVATLQWSGASNKRPYPFLGIGGNEHGLGHQSDSNTGTWEKLDTIRAWYAEQFFYIMEQLEATPEGDGTMLDNTVVLLGSEITRGNTHSHDANPFVLAGSAGGAIQTGQHLEFSGDSHNRLLVSLLNAMGDNSDSFGPTEFNNGPLPGLLV